MPKTFILVLLTGLAIASHGHKGSLAWGDDTEQRAEAIAKKVEQKAKSQEKKEGTEDRVKDHVEVKTDAQGEPVIEQLGEASYYGKNFHGKKTANGETFSQNKLTAAHPALPLGTEAKVTNLKTGKEVKVEINDRGPYVKGRDLDLSKAAAKKIGMEKEGIAPVKIEAKVPPKNEDRAMKPNEKKEKKG